MVQHWPSMGKVLGRIPNTTRNKIERNNKVYRKMCIDFMQIDAILYMVLEHPKILVTVGSLEVIPQRH